jgi:GNAT superfamily N-acetyltransferase
MQKVGLIENDELTALFPLICGVNLKNTAFSPNFDKSFLSDLLFLEIKKIMSENDGYVIGLKSKNKITGFCVIKKAEPESMVFGKEVYSLTHIISDGNYHESLKNKLALLAFLAPDFEKKIDMISCRVDSGDISTIHALEKQSYMLADGLNTYSFEMKNLSTYKRQPVFSTRLYQHADLEQLKEIARLSFSVDRFHNDPFIPKTKSDSLYEKFIENATLGIGADQIMVAENDSIILGFNTIEVQNQLMARYGIKIGSFILTAVALNYRNRGVYSSLIIASLKYLEETSDRAEIRTHFNNYPVHHVLSRLGFTITKSQLTFHRWK